MKAKFGFGLILLLVLASSAPEGNPLNASPADDGSLTALSDMKNGDFRHLCNRLFLK